MPLLGLPAELMLRIVYYLNKPTQVVLSRGCRDLRALLHGQVTEEAVMVLCRHKRLALLSLVERDCVRFVRHRCDVFRKTSSFDDRVTYRCGDRTQYRDDTCIYTRICLSVFDCYDCLLEHERTFHGMHLRWDWSRDGCYYNWCGAKHFSKHFEDVRIGHACCNPLEWHCEFIHDGLEKTHCGSVSVGRYNRYSMMIGVKNLVQGALDGVPSQKKVDERIVKIRREIGPCERTMFEGPGSGSDRISTTEPTKQHIKHTTTDQPQPAQTSQASMHKLHSLGGLLCDPTDLALFDVSGLSFGNLHGSPDFYAFSHRSSNTANAPTREKNVVTQATNANDDENNEIDKQRGKSYLRKRPIEGLLEPDFENLPHKTVRHNEAIIAPASQYGWTAGHLEYDCIMQDLFIVVSPLGHGSLGVVEEVKVSARRPSLVRKRVQLPFHSRRQRLEIIKQEAKVLKSMEHCHIVKIIGSYLEGPPNGKQFFSLLMSPVGDNDLKIFLEIMGESNRRDEKWRMWLVKWFKCLASALAYMHRQGVRHQDIKPSNIIHRSGTIYFTDFSSSSRFQIGHTTSTENPACTSAMYAAPEIINSSENGLTRHGRSTDIFALGLVYCEMQTVLFGKSIRDFHSFLLEGSEMHYPEAFAGFLQYGRMTDRIRAWFGHMGTLEFYDYLMRPMLAADRNNRPDACAVALYIQNTHAFKFCDFACTCD